MQKKHNISLFLLSLVSFSLNAIDQRVPGTPEKIKLYFPKTGDSVPNSEDNALFEADALSNDSSLENDPFGLFYSDLDDAPSLEPMSEDGQNMGASHLALYQRLFDAARTGNVTELYSLIGQGLYIDFQDAQGLTPLMLAIINGQVAAVQALVALGADIMTPDNRGYTAEYHAFFRGPHMQDAVRSLIR